MKTTARTIINWLKIKRHQKMLTLFFIIVFVGGVFLLAKPVQAFGVEDIVNALIEFVTRILLAIARFFLEIASFLLNFFIQIAGYNDFIYAPPVVLGWLVIRDLANMFFIVVLMIIAVGTILGVEKYEWKKSLVKLIFVAIFINFSKLILQLIIDAGYVLTSTFLVAFEDSAMGNLLQMFKIENLYKLSEAAGNKDGYKIELLIVGILALILAAMTMAIVFAYLLVLLARLVVLWVLMILSPLAFIAQAFPAGQKYAQEFWSKFINQVMVAPVMVFFLWLAFATLGAGTIVSDLNLGQAELQKAAVLQNLEGNVIIPAVAISAAGTWESLSGFLIAIAFLVVGITFVQRMGVVGGGLTAGAITFGKRVATIASGYAAGRWLVGRGGEKGFELLGGAGKFAARTGRLGLAKVGEGTGVSEAIQRARTGRARTGLGRAAGWIMNVPERGRAAEKRLEELREARKKEITAATRAGFLAPPEERVQETGARAAMAEEAKVKRKEQMRDRYIAEVLFKGDFNDYFANRGELLKKEYGVDLAQSKDEEIAGLAVKLKDAIAKENYTTAMDTMNDIDERMMELGATNKFDQVYDYQQSRQLDKDAAKASPMIADALEKIEAEELAGDAAARKNFVEGGFNLGYATQERLLFNKREADINKELITERVARMTDEEKQKALSEYGVAHQGEGLSLLSEEDEKQIFESSAANLISNQEKALRYKKEGIYKDLNKIGGEYLTYSGQRRLKKTKTIVEQMANRVGDYAREEENKPAQLVRAYEVRKAKEEATEKETFTFDELSETIRRNFQVQKTLGGIPKAELTDEQKNALYNATQDQFRTVANFMSRYGENAGGLLASLDASYTDKELTSKDGIQNMLLGLTSGRSYEEVTGNFSVIQEQVRKRLKEKESYLFRALQLGLNEAVKQGSGKFYNQITLGTDSSGLKKFGFTNNFVAGLGRGGALGTGKTGVDGSQQRQKDYDSMIKPSISLSGAKNGRALVATDGHGNALRALDEESRLAIRSLASLSKTALQSMDTNKIWSIFKNWGESPWDAATEKFDLSKDMSRDLSTVMTDFTDNFSNASTRNNRDNVLQAMKEFLRKLKVENINDKSLAKAEIGDVVSFLKDKLDISIAIKPLEGQKGTTVREEGGEEEEEEHY